MNKDDEISAIKIDLNHNSELLNAENEKLAPQRPKNRKLSKTSKNKFRHVKFRRRRKKNKKLSAKLENSLTTIESDLEREKSISLDASLNEKRILEEKSELLKQKSL